MLVMGFLNLIYYVLISPYLLWKYLKVRKWRKNVKVGDTGCFENVMDTFTVFKVVEISEDRKEILVDIKTRNSASHQWIELSGCYPCKSRNDE